MSKNRIAVLAFAAAVVAGVAGSSWADNPIYSTATARVGGAGRAEASFVIRNVPDHVLRSSITWSDVESGSTSWKIADQYFDFISTITSRNGRVITYTNNRDAGANPRYAGSTTTVCAGLLMATATVTTEPGLPMAWTIKTATQTIDTTLAAADPNDGPETGIGNKYQWFFYQDPGNPTGFWVGNAGPFVRILDRRGVHFSQGDGEFGGGRPGLKSYMYLEANFGAAAGDDTPYQTNRLTVEVFTN